MQIVFLSGLVELYMNFFACFTVFLNFSAINTLLFAIRKKYFQKDYTSKDCILQRRNMCTYFIVIS